jgi:hypothetical protein
MELDQAPPKQAVETTSEASNTEERKMEDFDSGMNNSELQIVLDLEPNHPALETPDRYKSLLTATAASIYTIPTPDSPSARTTVSTRSSTSTRSQQEELNDRQHSRVHQVAAMTGLLNQELIRQKTLVEQLAAMTGKLDQLGNQVEQVAAMTGKRDLLGQHDGKDESSYHQEEKKDEKDIQRIPNQSQDLPLVDGMSDDDSLSTNSSQHGHGLGYGIIHHTCSGLMQAAELAQDACQVNNTIENNECLVLRHCNSNDNFIIDGNAMAMAMGWRKNRNPSNQEHFLWRVTDCNYYPC